MTAKSTVVSPSSGQGMRRRVRRITVWVAGAAGVGSAVLTASLAEASHSVAAATPDAPASAASPSTAAPSTTSPTHVTAPRTAAPAPATTSLAAPTQAPRAGQGRSQVRSGGS